MVEIPQITAKGGSRVQLGGINAPSPVVASNRGLADTARSQAIKGLFDYAGDVYQERMIKLERIKQERMQNEGIVAIEKHRSEVMRGAMSQPKTDRIGWATEQSQAFEEEFLAQYEDMPLIQARLKGSLQRTVLSVQDKIFQQTEAEEKRDYLTSVENAEPALTMDFLESQTPMHEMNVYDQLDQMADQAVKIGAMAVEDSDQYKQSMRAKLESAKFTHELSQKDYKKARSRLENAKDFLGIERYIQLDQSYHKALSDERNRIQKQWQETREKAIEDERKMLSDPAAVMVERGTCQPNDPVCLNKATNGRSLMSKDRAEATVEMFFNNDDIDSLFQITDIPVRINKDAFVRDIERSTSAKDKPYVRQIINIVSNPESRKPKNIEKSRRVIQALQESRGIKPKEIADTQGIKLSDALTKVTDSQTFKDYQRFSQGALKGAMAAPNGTKAAMAIRDTALAYMSRFGGSYEDAVEMVQFSTPHQYTDVNGVTYAIPDSVAENSGFEARLEGTLYGDPLRGGYIKDILMPHKEWTVNGKPLPLEDKMAFIEGGAVDLMPVNDATDDALVLSINGVPVRDSEGKVHKVNYKQLNDYHTTYTNMEGNRSIAPAGRTIMDEMSDAIDGVADVFVNVLSAEDKEAAAKEEKGLLKKMWSTVVSDADAASAGDPWGAVPVQELRSYANVAGISNYAMAFINQVEGYRERVYDDTKGIKTVGYGFNMEESTNKKIWKKAGIKKDWNAVKSGKQSLSRAESLLLLKETKRQAQEELADYLPEGSYNPPQKEMLTSFLFQYGKTKLHNDKKFRAALQSGDTENIALNWAGYYRGGAGVARRRSEEITRFLSFEVTEDIPKILDSVLQKWNNIDPGNKERNYKYMVAAANRNIPRLSNTIRESALNKIINNEKLSPIEIAYKDYYKEYASTSF